MGWYTRITGVLRAPYNDKQAMYQIYRSPPSITGMCHISIYFLVNVTGFVKVIHLSAAPGRLLIQRHTIMIGHHAIPHTYR